MVKRIGGLSEDDRTLWKRLTDSTEPLRKDDPANVVESASMPARRLAEPAISPFPASSSSNKAALRMSLGDDIPGHASILMDRRSFERLRKGGLRPEARLDLHGMTSATAHSRLNSFIVNAHDAGLRLVLIITGKGRIWPDETGSMPVRKGVLRHSVPHWLAQTELRVRILQVTQAHAKHGGGGALYIYLRRNRSQE